MSCYLIGSSSKKGLRDPLSLSFSPKSYCVGLSGVAMSNQNQDLLKIANKITPSIYIDVKKDMDGVLIYQMTILVLSKAEPH